MPKRKPRKVSGDPILQDCNITSASNIDTEVSYPSDKSFGKNIENCDVSYCDLNQSPSCSHTSKLVEDCQVMDLSDVKFKVPFSTKNVRNRRASLFDSVLCDSEPNTPESSAKSEPFKRKCTGKEISFSTSSSNDSINNNLSARRELKLKFVRKQITISKTSVENNIFDSDLDESINKSKLSSCEANNSSQIQSRKSSIVNYKSQKLSSKNSGMFDSDLESSDMTRNISNLSSIEEENGTSHENITKRNKNKKASCVSKFLAKSKTTRMQDFGNNTFDSILVNRSSNDISSESSTEFHSSLSRREVLLAEETNSTDNIINNLSSGKSPRLPFVKTKNTCDEVNADMFESDLEASDISLHCTKHTTDTIINTNSLNTKSPQPLFVKAKNNFEEVNEGIFESNLEASNTSLQCTYTDESQYNGIDSEKKGSNVFLSNVENSNDCNVMGLNMSQDFASKALVTQYNPMSYEDNISFTSKAGSSTSILVNNKEPDKELLNGFEHSRAFRSSNNSHGSETSLVKSICQVSKDEVNAMSDNSEIGAQIISEEESRNNTVPNCLYKCPSADIKHSIGKRVSFRIDSGMNDTTSKSARGKNCSVQQVENNSSTSLHLVYDDPSEVLNSESVLIDIHASRSRNTGSSVNSNSENQLMYSNKSDGSVENEDIAKNIPISEHNNFDECESDHEREGNTGSTVNADIDDEVQEDDEENIVTNYGNNDNSTKISSNKNTSDDDTEENKENYPGGDDDDDDDDGDINNYSNDDISANHSDASSFLHSNFIGSVQRPFEGENELSERYATGNASSTDEDDGHDRSPIIDLSERRSFIRKTQDPEKSVLPVNRNVYEQYDSFFKSAHHKGNPIPHTDQAECQPRAHGIIFKKPCQKKSSKSRTRNILVNLPFSELKTKQRLASEANREQTMHNEIEESLKKRKKQQPTASKLNSGKLKKPKKWVRSTMYEFIINKLKPKYGVNSRVQAEKLVVYLVGQVDKVLKIQDLSFYSVVEEMKLTLASLKVVQTHFDFREFIMKYFDAPFSFKVYPFGGDIWNPFEPKNMFEVIPIED